MKKILKRFMSILLVAIMVLGITACSKETDNNQDKETQGSTQGQEDNTDGQGSDNTEPVTLKVTYFASAGMEVWFQALKEGFEAAHENVTVELDGDLGVMEKMSPMLEAGENLPDVAFLLNTNWQFWADKGYLADLTDLFEGDSADDGSFKDTLSDAGLNYSMYRDTARIVPWNDGVLGIAYNKGMFEEHGWEVPTTWSEMEALCEQIKEKNIDPFVYPGQVIGYWDFMVNPMIVSAGGFDYLNQYLTMEKPEDWENPGRLAAYEQFEKLFENGYMLNGSEALNHTSAQMEFVNGRAAMIPNGSWLENEMRESTPEGFEMAMMAVPAMENAVEEHVTYNMIGDFIMVPEKAAQKELAKEFIKFACSQEMNTTYTELTGNLRPFKYDLSNIPVSDFVKSVLDVMNNNKSFNINSTSPMYLRINDEFVGGKAVGNIASGTKTAEQQYNDEVNFIKENWDSFKQELGIE